MGVLVHMAMNNCSISRKTMIDKPRKSPRLPPENTYNNKVTAVDPFKANTILKVDCTSAFVVNRLLTQETELF